MSDNTEKTLEMRVAELEDKLKGLQVTEEEMRAFNKVASMMGLIPQAGAAAAADVATATPAPPAGTPIVQCVRTCVVQQCVRTCVVQQCVRTCVVQQCIRTCVVQQCIRTCIIQDCINECGGGLPGGGGFSSGGFESLGDD